MTNDGQDVVGEKMGASEERATQGRETVTSKAPGAQGPDFKAVLRFLGNDEHKKLDVEGRYECLRGDASGT